MKHNGTARWVRNSEFLGAASVTFGFQKLSGLPCEVPYKYARILQTVLLSSECNQNLLLGISRGGVKSLVRGAM